MFKKSIEKATKKSQKETKPDIDTEEAGEDPRGSDVVDNTPEHSGAPVTLPSQKRPYNPSDAIEDQIEASDARTKQPGHEFEKMNDEQLKDYAVSLGIDGNDGLKREDIIGKIQAFDNKRMFPDENGNYENSHKTVNKVKKDIEN